MLRPLTHRSRGRRINRKILRRVNGNFAGCHHRRSLLSAVRYRIGDDFEVFRGPDIEMTPAQN